MYVRHILFSLLSLSFYRVLIICYICGCRYGEINLNSRNAKYSGRKQNSLKTQKTAIVTFVPSSGRVQVCQSR